MNLIFFLLVIFYNLIYTSLVLLAFILKPLLDQKSKLWIELRNFNLFQLPVLDPLKKTIWIHASSGEIEYAKSIIREINRDNDLINKIQIIVSYSSLSAPRLFKNIESQHVLSFFPLPWDLFLTNLNLINKLKPDLVLFSRTDFWINLVAVLRLKNIKHGVFSANPSHSQLGQFIFKLITNKMSLISVVNSSPLEKKMQNLKVTHDTRFDQVFYRLQQPSLFKFNKQTQVLTLGSTWPKDDQYFFPLVNELTQKYQVIWVPHDLKNINYLSEYFRSHNIPFILYSDFLNQPHINKNNLVFPVLLIDQIGLLADIYRLSDISFVGGSFVKKVHSVMEPLMALNKVIVGPYYLNNPEAIEFKNKNLISVVNSTDEIKNELLLNLYENNQLNENNLNDLKKELQVELNKKLGGTNILLNEIKQILQIK